MLASQQRRDFNDRLFKMGKSRLIENRDEGQKQVGFQPLYIQEGVIT